MGYSENIQALIDERIAYYKTNPKEIARDYTIEKSVQEEYDGRQLLEMLQNVDDTGSSKIRISWNKESKKLAISNYGEAFSVSGIESLMRSHSSPKTKENYIGNKGLGFRSLLSWANIIDIYANDCKISFSEETAAAVFNKELSLSLEEKAAIRKQCNVSNNVTAFPTLAIPELNKVIRQDDWQTVIEISYIQDVEKKIEAIFKNITDELLLFLRHINEIELVVEGVITSFKSTKTEHNEWDEVHINEKKWRVFTQKGPLPPALQDDSEGSIKMYMLKIAFQDDLSDSYQKLFNFFPTKISVALPCIIHGTFDLNTSRDYINPTDGNIYIFKQLAKFLVQTSVLLTDEDISWKPYQLVKPIIASSEVNLVDTLYKDLIDIGKKAKIVPTINKEYTVYKNAKYYNEDFNSFFKDNFPDILPELVLPLASESKSYFKTDHFEYQILNKKIDALSYTPISIPQRAELIYQLINCGSPRNKEERFSLLVNAKEGAVISKDTITFTPMVQSQSEFSIPESLKLDFINTELYEILYKKLEVNFDPKNQSSREFQSAVKEVVNVQPYDSNSVIKKIVSGINTAIDDAKTLDEKRDLVKEMVRSLFDNFQHIKTELTSLDLDISLLNKNNEIVKSTSLFMGNNYPDGEMVEWLYKEIYTDANFLIQRDYWELTNANPDELERFFIWLGVNKFTKLGNKKLDGKWEEQPYFNYLFQANNPGKPINFQIDRIHRDTFDIYIENMEDVVQMDITRKIVLILRDERVRNKIEELETKLLWRYVQTSYTLATSISYIKYQFLKEGIFNTYVLEDGNDSLKHLVNYDSSIDFSLLCEYGFTSQEVAPILVKLGAKQSVASLEPSVLYDALLRIPAFFSENKRGAQSVYKILVDALAHQNSILGIQQGDIPKNLRLFAKKGKETVLLPAKEVFYSNNSVLPKKIEKIIPIFDFPKRGGQDKVKQFLGVQILDTSQIILNKVENAFQLNIDFNNLFESLKLPILLYRLYSNNLQKEVVTKEALRQNVSYLKNCTITLVHSCTYRYADNDKVELEDFEFVIFEDAFYLKIPLRKRLDTLLRESTFSDAFAEILSIQFNVTELKNDFRFLIRNDLRDTLHLMRQDFDEEKINNVQNYFGISTLELKFWQAIYAYKKIDFPVQITKQKNLLPQIEKDLRIKLSPDYHKFNYQECTNIETYEVLNYLVAILDIPLKNLYPQGIQVYHNESLRNIRESNEVKVRNLVWEYLDINKDQQNKYLSYLDSFKLVPSHTFFEEDSKFSIQINYNEIFKKFIERELPINFLNKPNEDTYITNLYEHLINKYNCELDDIEDKIKSLFYFKGNDSSLQSFLDTKFPKENSLTNDPKDEVVIPEVILSLVDSSLSSAGVSIHTNDGIHKPKKKKRMRHSKQADQLKEISGKNAEIKAVATYKKLYGENKVHWVSGYSNTSDNNDNLQYDLKYEDGNGIWKYVEVKSLSNKNTFILTKDEKYFGMDNNAIYEFALVTEKGIHRISSPFTFDVGDNFETNNSFRAEAKDYQLHFKLKTK